MISGGARYRCVEAVVGLQMGLSDMGVMLNRVLRRPGERERDF